MTGVNNTENPHAAFKLSIARDFRDFRSSNK